MNRLKHLTTYIWSRRTAFFLLICINVLFFFTFKLYNVWIEPFFAIFLAEFVLSAFFIMRDYLNYTRIYRMIFDLNRQKIHHLPTSYGEANQPILEEIILFSKRQSDHIKQLESANIKERDDLQAHFSKWLHQIKTPITALQLMIEKLEHSEKQAMQSQLQDIDSYAQMALVYLRLESVSNDLLLKKVLLVPIIEKVVKKHKYMIIDKQLKVQLPTSDINVISDEKWLFFAIDQLVSNAVKYTLRGSISIQVISNDKVLLSVTDTGIGIYPEDLPRIFERGYTGYNGRLYQKSTGIGLNLAKRAIDMLGHQLSITSQLDHGTKATIHF